jgi:hypothetical protein
VFIQQLSNSDERIKRSCKEKNIGGYINMEMIIKEEESKDENETKEEDDEKCSDIEFRYDMVYNSIEIKEKVSGEEKVKALIEFYEKNNRLPIQKEECISNKKTFKIGMFWHKIKEGYHSKLYKQYLCGIKIFKQEYEKYQISKKENLLKKELTFEQKIKALIHFCENNERLPKGKEECVYEGITFNIGIFWSHTKERNNNIYEKYFSGIKIFKDEYDRYQLAKKEKQLKKELTSVQKVQGLIEFYEKYKRLPAPRENYTYKDIEFKIKSFWSSIKEGKNNKLYEEHLSKIKIFKDEYDRYQLARKEKQLKKELTSVQKVQGLIEFYEKYKRLPASRENYTYEGIDFKIGSFWFHVKEQYYNKLYEEYLSNIEVFKEEYERYQRSKKKQRVLTPLEKIKALIEYNRIPRQLDVYTYEEIEFKIGAFFNSVKGGQCKELYKEYLSKIPIFQEDYERSQKLKEKKKLKKN